MITASHGSNPSTAGTDDIEQIGTYDAIEGIGTNCLLQKAIEFPRRVEF